MAARGSRSLREKVTAAGADPVQSAIIKATDSTKLAPKSKHVEGAHQQKEEKKEKKKKKER